MWKCSSPVLRELVLRQRIVLIYFQSRRPRARVTSQRDMQLETHCVQNAQNSLEVWMP
jgi:hypothetical protein